MKPGKTISIGNHRTKKHLNASIDWLKMRKDNLLMGWENPNHCERI